MKKKFFLSAVVLILALSLSACQLPGKNKQVRKLGETITNMQFENELKELVDISEYDYSENVYTLKTENNFEYDRVFQLENKKIDFKSAEFKKLKKIKVMYDGVLDSVKVDSNTESDYYFPEFKGVTMSAQAYNDSDKQQNLKNCKIKTLILKRSIDPETFFPEFSFTNGVTEKSDWKELFEKFGKPNYIYCTIDAEHPNAPDVITVQYSNSEYNLVFDYCNSAQTFESISFINIF